MALATKDEIVDLVIIILSGGVPNEDNAIWRADIYPLVEPALQNAINEFSQTLGRKNKLREDGGYDSDMGDSELSSLIRTEKVTFEKIDGCTMKAKLPRKLLRGAFRSNVIAKPSGCNDCRNLVHLFYRQQRVGLPDALSYIWVEDGDTAFASPANSDTLDLDVTAHWIGQDADGNVLVPDSVKTKVVEYLVALYSRQLNAKDNINDGIDEKDSANR